MHNAIASLLERRGIKKVEDLKATERAKVDTWMKIFEKEIKLSDLKDFIEKEISRLEKEWLESDDKNPFAYLFEWKKNIETKGRIRNYRNLINFLDEPAKNKEKLEKYLRKLIS